MTSPKRPIETEQTALPFSGLALLICLTIVWGLNWPVMKTVLAEVPVWWFRSSCVIVGGLGLLLVTAMAGARIFPSRHEIPAMLFCAIFSIIGWHLCTAYGLSLMPAGRASIIAYTMPLWAALFGSLILGERLTWSKFIGQFFGLAGLIVLIGPDFLVFQTAPLGAMFMLAAALSWGLGMVLFKRTNWSTPVSATVGWQLLAGGIPITIGAILIQEPPNLEALQATTWAGLLFVFALPMIFGQWAFYKIVNMFPASVAAMSTLAVPVIGVYSSALILNEVVTLNDVLALGLICIALFAVLVVPALRSTSAWREKRNS